jgi:alpha-tubulin suppressor-like RCC1 family protein
MAKQIRWWTVLAFSLMATCAPAQMQTWGSNYVGQIGNGLSGLPNLNNPTPVTIAGLTDVIAVSGGEGHSLAVKSDGTVMTWGMHGQPPSLVPVPVTVLTNVIAVSGGFSHSLALEADGTVWAWGNNDSGQLGDFFSHGSNSLTPVQVGVGQFNTTPGFDNIVAIAAGLSHNLALKADGTVWTWGANTSGQLGLGDISTRFSPQQVPGLSGMISIGGGQYHSAAVKSDGTVWVWGNNGAGELGDGTTVGTLPGSVQPTPVQNMLISGVAQIAVADRVNVALKSDGTVWAWGYNEFGQVGNGTFTTTPSCLCVMVPTQTTIANVSEVRSSSGLHILARKLDGSIWAWGYNAEGEAGTGAISTTAPYSLPTPVQTSVGTGNAIFNTGRQHSLLSVPIVPVSAGAAITAQLGVAHVTFANVTTPGTMTITAIDPGSVGLPPPATFVIQSNVQAYSIATTAAFDHAMVCIQAATVFALATFNSLRILHVEGGVLVDRTTTRDYARREICGVVTSFSPFLLATSPLPPSPVLNGTSSRKPHGAAIFDLPL